MRACVWLAVWLLAASVATGCGDDGESPQERLQGNWVGETSDAVCARVLTVEGKMIELKLLCELEDGSLGLEVHTGTFTATDSEIEWRFERSTCADPGLRPESPDTVRYSFVGDSLRLIMDYGAIVLKPVEEPTGSVGSAEYEFGCYDADDYFEPAPIEDI